MRGNRLARFTASPISRSIPACAGEPRNGVHSHCAIAVYPRVCGGTATWSIRAIPGGGLSPRVRGNLSPPQVAPVSMRSIPACAGEPPSGAVTSMLPSVYPRVCGGTVYWPVREYTARGLSPRVRGNRPDSRIRISIPGSIPACAGEPAGECRLPCCARVYPRVCGGTSPPSSPRCHAGGLSPRVRGNPARCIQPFHPLGSIPACAGEPDTITLAGGKSAVYPRVCGGTPASGRKCVVGAGLSPRVRGNPLLGRVRVVAAGSIPACAGEPGVQAAVVVGGGVYPRVCGGTRYSDLTSALQRVYPRVCGGTGAGPAGPPGRSGLSPRVRGNPASCAAPRAGRRSIPACAGEPPTVSYRPSPCRVYPRVCGGTGHSTDTSRPTRVYPRVCGGTPSRPGASWTGWGLSPRVRGNPNRFLTVCPSSRSIPACAGEPLTGWRPAAGPGVYPRVCGGTSDGLAPSSWSGGLSPRVRGNRLPSEQQSHHPGSIPACAGEPAARARRRRRKRVYPRVCGGTGSSFGYRGGSAGLSPRVRGNPWPPPWTAWSARSIPACAGEPHTPAPAAAWCGVYPRVCGGTYRSGFPSRTRMGLSPRVRGNLHRHGGHPDRAGSIPACAGEPRGDCRRRVRSGVYPRVCGGTVAVYVKVRAVLGLSPRVRGNRIVLAAELPAVGSIPACAGEPSLRRAGAGPDGVYPRVCGGTNQWPSAPQTGRGLSPRVRGNPHRRLPQRMPPRSIPACAGEPCDAKARATSGAVYPRVCGGTRNRMSVTIDHTGLSPRVRGNLKGQFRRATRAGSIPACAGEPPRRRPSPLPRPVYPRVCGGTKKSQA